MRLQKNNGHSVQLQRACNCRIDTLFMSLNNALVCVIQITYLCIDASIAKAYVTETTIGMCNTNNVLVYMTQRVHMYTKYKQRIRNCEENTCISTCHKNDAWICVIQTSHLYIDASIAKAYGTETTHWYAIHWNM